MGSHSLLQDDLPGPGIEPEAPALQADSSPSEPPGNTTYIICRLSDDGHSDQCEVVPPCSLICICLLILHVGHRFTCLLTICRPGGIVTACVHLTWGESTCLHGTRLPSCRNFATCSLRPILGHVCSLGPPLHKETSGLCALVL